MNDDGKDVPVLSSTKNRTIVVDIKDPFSLSGEELKKVSGLDANVKRRRTRAIEKAYTGHEGSASKRDEAESEIDAYNLFGVVLPKYNLDYLAKIYEMSAPHSAAVNAKVANIAGLGYDFVESHSVRRKIGDASTEKKKESMRKKLNDAKEEMYDWLDGCNEEDTFSETLMKVWTDYEVTGNGYFEVSRTLSGTVGYIGHIPSTTIRIRKIRDGYVQMVANRAKFFRNFGDQDTTDPVGNDPRPNEIIHIKKYSPTGQFYGVPDIIAAQQAIVGNEFAARFNLDYFENKAVPRYVIVVKGGNFSETGEQNIVEFFETGLKGKNHRTIYIPLPADDDQKKTSFEMKPVEAGTQDSSFVNYRKGNLSDILMAHRVPISKVSQLEGISLAASKDADKTFKEQVCRPQQKILEKKLNKIIKEVSAGNFLLKLNELSLTDEDQQSKIDERYLRYGVITPNEKRRDMGKEAIPTGDETYIEATAKATGTNPGAQQQAETRAQTNQSRTRDQERSANATDSNGAGRSAQGEGRAQG